MKCGVGLCGHCQLGPLLVCRDGPVVDYARAPTRCSPSGSSDDAATRHSPSGSSPPATAASSPCSTARTSCSRSRAPCGSRTSSRRPAPSCRDRTTCRWSRARSRHRSDAQRIRRVREQSTVLVTIGACATAGGIQALRNVADVEEFRSVVYASPQYIDTLATSTPIAAHVPVDLELRGCPIDKHQLLEVISALLAGPQAGPPRHERLHRVQAPRADLRDGRERHPLPRPGHARRLRRALPRRRARLLRLLRPDDAAPTSPRWSTRLRTLRDEPADGRPGLRRRST